jgi:hypothetical protein
VYENQEIKIKSIKKIIKTEKIIKSFYTLIISENIKKDILSMV